MKTKINTTGLNQVARVLTPAAMVIFLTMEIVNSQQGIGGWIYPVAIAALFTSVGIEAWGMMSGANVEKSWLLNRSKLSSGVQLVLYVGVTMWLLKSNQTLIALPIVAALVYVSAALYESLNNHQVRQDTVERQSLAIQIRQQEAQAQRDHEARLKQMELDARAKIALETKHEENETAVKLARIEAKAQRATIAPATMPQLAPQVAPQQELTPSQLRILEAFKENPTASITAVAKQLNVTRQYVSGEVKKMNGVLHEVRL